MCGRNNRQHYGSVRNAKAVTRRSWYLCHCLFRRCTVKNASNLKMNLQSTLLSRKRYSATQDFLGRLSARKIAIHDANNTPNATSFVFFVDTWRRMSTNIKL